MQHTILRAGCCLFSLLLPTALDAQQTRPPGMPAVAGTLAGQRADVPPQGSSANRWRYSFHNGHWWYYRDGGRWAYWTGTTWADYEPKSYGHWYVQQKMAEYDAELARFDARLMRPYRSPLFTEGNSGIATYNYRGPTTAPGLTSPSSVTSPWPGTGGIRSGLFSPRAFDGRLNPATSIGGYMGGALRGPSGY